MPTVTISAIDSTTVNRPNPAAPMPWATSSVVAAETPLATALPRVGPAMRGRSAAGRISRRIAGTPAGRTPGRRGC